MGAIESNISEILAIFAGAFMAGIVVSLFFALFVSIIVEKHSSDLSKKIESLKQEKSQSEDHASKFNK